MPVDKQPSSPLPGRGPSPFGRGPLARLLGLPRALSAWLVARPARRYAVAGMMLALPLGLAVLGIVRGRAMMHKEVAQPERITLAAVFDAVERGYFAEARQLAEKVARQKLAPNEHGGPDFVLAAVAAHEADEVWGQEKQNYHLLAVRHLEIARDRGFELALGPQGEFLLGTSLYRAGRVAQSRAVLERALELNPQETAPLHEMLSSAWRRRPDRDLHRALEHSQQYLATLDLPAPERESGLLRQAQIQWQLKDYGACRATLDLIPRNAFVNAEASLLRGRIFMREAAELRQALTAESGDEARQAVKARYQQAIGCLRRAQEDPLGNRAIRRSMYLIGVCFLESDDTRAALAQFERTRNVYLDTPEGLAAGLEEGDLLLSLGREDEALVAYRRMLGAIKGDRAFRNPWIASKQFRIRIEHAYRRFMETDQYERAISLAERMSPLFPASRGVELAAESNHVWAQALLRSAEALPEPQAGQRRQQARVLFRTAGELFGRLATLEFTDRRYPEDIWRSAESYLAGHQYTRAVAALEEYMRYESRRRRPAALVYLGEALLALGRNDEALAMLKECIEFYPNDATAFQARLWAARANLENGDAAGAEALLRENLNGHWLTPDSKEWRDSLFALGKLLAESGRPAEAVDRLEEAVARYPDSRQAIIARYLIAEALRQAAKAPRERAASDTVESVRIGHLKEAQQLLEKAISYFEQTQQVLNSRQEKTELSLLEQTTLRNAYFASGACLFDLGRYEEAIRAYATASNRYQHEPEVLEAFVQIATCYRHLNKSREARGTVQQAKLVLDRISADASFSVATIYSRREWAELLEWLSHL